MKPHHPKDKGNGGMDNSAGIPAATAAAAADDAILTVGDVRGRAAAPAKEPALDPLGERMDVEVSGPRSGCGSSIQT